MKSSVLVELKDDRAQSFLTTGLGHVTLRPGINSLSEAEVYQLRANRWFRHMASIGRVYVLDPDFGDLSAEDQKAVVDLINDPTALEGYWSETSDRGVKVKIRKRIQRLEKERGHGKA